MLKWAALGIGISTLAYFSGVGFSWFSSSSWVLVFAECVWTVSGQVHGAPRTRCTVAHSVPRRALVASLSLYTWLAFPGMVGVDDLGRVMNGIGLEPSAEELKNMITEVDGSGRSRSRSRSCSSPLSLSFSPSGSVGRPLSVFVLACPMWCGDVNSLRNLPLVQ